MEIIIISIAVIILVTAIIGPSRPHEGPSFIITPIEQTYANRGQSNSGCLIVAVMAIIFFIAVASLSM